MSIFDVDDLDWRVDALCQQVSAEWFPGKGGSTKDAKTVCALCTVRAQCLADVMRAERGGHWDRHGVFAGLSPNEREALALTGWGTGDPLPELQTRRPDPDVCTTCDRPYRNMRLHERNTHAGAA